MQLCEKIIHLNKAKLIQMEF